MIKIKLYQLDKHRNEINFRPFLRFKDLFYDIGVEFVTDGNADFAFVGHASFINKKLILDESIKFGLNFLKTVKEPYFLFDGQDSATLIGSYEILERSNAIYLFKNTLYKDLNLYTKPFVNGRLYWGNGDYKLNNIDLFNKIKLSYMNWLSTLQPIWYEYNENKQYDISAMFSPSQSDTYEHGINQSIHYKKHRDNLFKNLDTKYKITKIENGIKLPPQEYYNRMYNSKITLAPFGFGEIAPRDLESSMFGSILLKPDMSHIDTFPNIFIPYVTYIPCNHNFTDLNQKIDTILFDYKNNQEKFVENFKSNFIKSYNPKNFVIYYYEILKNVIEKY